MKLSNAKTDSAKRSKMTPPETPSSKKDKIVGQVLKSVYQSAVEEDIPAQMLDLLSKLD